MRHLKTTWLPFLALAVLPADAGASCNHASAPGPSLGMDPQQLQVLTDRPVEEAPSPPKPGTPPPCIRCGAGQGMPTSNAPPLERLDALPNLLTVSADLRQVFGKDPWSCLYSLELVRRIDDPPRSGR